VTSNVKAQTKTRLQEPGATAALVIAVLAAILVAVQLRSRACQVELRRQRATGEAEAVRAWGNGSMQLGAHSNDDQSCMPNPTGTAFRRRRAGSG
jgi:hypothetical protein